MKRRVWIEKGPKRYYFHESKESDGFDLFDIWSKDFERLFPHIKLKKGETREIEIDIKFAP